MTEYSNESSYQNEKPKISCHFKENGSKTGKVHLPLSFQGLFDQSLYLICWRVEMLWFQLKYRLENWIELFHFERFVESNDSKRTKFSRLNRLTLDHFYQAWFLKYLEFSNLYLIFLILETFLGFFINKKSFAVTNNVCHQHCSLDIFGNQGHFLLIRILIFVTY